MKNIKQIVWTNFFGEKSPVGKLSDQHLSNILWFNEFFYGDNRYNSVNHFQLGLELADRNIKRLPWKPLPIPGEVEILINMGVVHLNGSIYGNKNCSIYEGKEIGSITHIKGWKDFLNKVN